MIDLHTHTTYSDGTLTPTQLVELAAKIGLRAVAITDHDSVDALEEGLEAGRRLGVEVVPGLEINLEYERVTLDLLAYFFGELPGKELRDKLAELRRYRDERNARILARLAALGYPISADELAAIAESGAVGRPHIGEAMRRRGYVQSIAEAFDRFLRRNAPAWVDRRRLGLAEALRLVQRAGGLPVMAHPGIIRTDAGGLARLTRAAARLGLAGFECYYGVYDEATVKSCLQLAERFDLVATGGSDFHGAVKPGARLGAGPAGRPIPDSVLDGLKERARARGAGRCPASPRRV